MDELNFQEVVDNMRSMAEMDGGEQMELDFLLGVVESTLSGRDYDVVLFGD